MHYIGTVNSNLICCICRAPFIEPTTTSCSHTFCKDCITQAIQTAPQCPVDRSSLNEGDLRTANPIIRHLVDELQVECPQRSHGCSHTCQRQWISTHLKDNCNFVKVQCCQEQCDAMVLRRDIGKHSDTCEHRTVECEACGIKMKSIDFKAHHEQCPVTEVACSYCASVLPRGDMSSHSTTCPNFIIKCDHAALGCPWEGPRNTLKPSHSMQCPYEAIKGFFDINMSRLSALEAENSQLRERVEDLERALGSTKRDVQTVRHALGPWFHPDGGHSPPRPPPPSEPAPRPYHRRRLSNALSSAMFGFSPDPTSAEPDSVVPLAPQTTAVSSGPSDSFAQFFPPPETSPPQTSVSPEGLVPPTVDGTYPRCTPNSSVAPLNLNTTLEGSLTSLRSSIVTLAASLDSESRRHDIALTTESLRVNEEVGSLRAIVHGLRMQVHQIMMDRNSQVTGNQDEDGGGYFPSTRSPNVEPWTSSVRYLNHYPPMHRPISIGHTTTTHIQSTKL